MTIYQTAITRSKNAYNVFIIQLDLKKLRFRIQIKKFHFQNFNVALKGLLLYLSDK